MADSSSPLDLLNFSQNAKETTANALLDAASPATGFGRRATTTTGLTWGYYGGKLWLDGVLTTIANSTISLSASSTNYVERTRAGVVSKNTTGFSAGQIPLYEIVTGASSITSYTDRRIQNPPFVGRLSRSVAGGASVTLTAAEARNNQLVFTGALTANISVIVPAEAQQWTIYNNTSGAFTLTVKTAAGTGVAVGQGLSAILVADGTNVRTAVDSTAGGGTVTTTAGALTANAVVLGAGGVDTKVVAGIVSDGISKVTLGVAGASVGATAYNNATSGTITVQPVAGALGAVTLSLPATTGTLALTSQLTGTLDGLSDVVITTPATGATLIYDGANWIDGALDLADSDARTGILSVANGGLGIASGTSGGILGYTASGVLASSVLLAANGIVLGGGAGATPTATAAMTNGQLLVGQTGAAPLQQTISGAITLNSSGVAAINTTLPTIQVFLSGSGTYTTPAGCRWIRVRGVGSGAGGAGGGSGGSPGDGSNGAATTFGSLTGNGGFKRAGSGGTATGGDINFQGGTGGVSYSGSGGVNYVGGSGGTSSFGGNSLGVSNGTPSVSGANTGSGGGGGGGSVAPDKGEGGASGGTFEKIINSPSATYSYSVAAGGAAGAGGTLGSDGVAGAAGIIIVEEFYV